MALAPAHGWRSCVLALGIALGFAAAPATAVGFAGFAVTPVSTGDGRDEAAAMAIAPDGKIVLAGRADPASDGNDDFAVVRYKPNGDLDTTFGGGDGIVTTNTADPNAGQDDTASAVVVQPDSKIVVVGGSPQQGSGMDFTVVRYTDAGAPDPSFGGGDGIVTTSFGAGATADFAADVALQADGNIVVVGASGTGSTRDFALARYSGLDGSLDPAFDGPAGDGNGRFLHSLEPTFDVAQAVMLQGTKIVVAGSLTRPGFSTGDFALARYNAATGTLDDTWDGETGDNGNGVVRTTFTANDDSVQALGLLGGDIVAAGNADSGGGATGIDFALARYDVADGKLDTAFDGDGKLTTPVAAGAGTDATGDMTVQSDDKVVVVGNSFPVGGQEIGTAARYIGANGFLDATFDGPGTAGDGSFNFNLPGTEGNRFRGVLEQKNSPVPADNGKLLLGGKADAGDATGLDFALARFDPATGAFDTTFAPAPVTANPTGNTGQQGSGVQVGPVLPSAAALLAAVRGDLRELNRLLTRLGVDGLLSAGGVTVRGDALAAGTVRLDGFFTGGTPLRPSAATKILSGKRTFTAAGKARIRLKLNRKGRRLLRRSRRARLQLRGSFTNTAGKRVASSKRNLSLKRKKPKRR